MPIILRLAKLEDKDIILASFRKQFDTETEENIRHTFIIGMGQANNFYLQTHIVVLENEGEIIGSVAFDASHVYALYVNEEERKKGYGTMLMSAAVQFIEVAAFDNYGCGTLLNNYPQLAFTGICNLNLRALNDLIVAKRLVVISAIINLQKIKALPDQTGLLSIFGSDKATSIAAINEFLNGMHNVTSLPEIERCIKTLPESGLAGQVRGNLLVTLEQVRHVYQPRVVVPPQPQSTSP